MDMHNSFWFGNKLNDFLFKGLDVNSVAGLVALCCALAAVAVLFEGLKVLHSDVKLKTFMLSSHVRHNPISPNDGELLLGSNHGQIRRKRAISYFVEINLYIIQVVLGYLLMLTVMTYNVYVSMAILLGVAVGYTFFGQMLIEKRLKSTHLAMPCQHCVQVEGKDSSEDTVQEDASSSGCCSRTKQLETTTEILD